MVASGLQVLYLMHIQQPIPQMMLQPATNQSTFQLG